MEYEDKYKEDIEQYIQVVKRFNELTEYDISGAYHLMKQSFGVCERWSKIRYDIKKDLKRGEKAAFKERLDDMCKYLKEISTTSRMIWNQARKNYERNGE